MAHNQLSQLLEREVAVIRQCEGMRAGDRMRIDRRYQRILELLRPRIAWLVRRYGLSHIRQDAEQACAIGVMRAVRAWDQSKASFATLAHWQMRGELQSLRHRMMPDQRQSARSAGVRTVSWHNTAGQERAELTALPDGSALALAERGASDLMAHNVLDQLLGRLDSPVQERRIVEAALFAESANDGLDRTARERNRQIVRRTFRNCAKVVVGSSYGMT